MPFSARASASAATCRIDDRFLKVRTHCSDVSDSLQRWPLGCLSLHSGQCFNCCLLNIVVLVLDKTSTYCRDGNWVAHLRNLDNASTAALNIVIRSLREHPLQRWHLGSPCLQPAFWPVLQLRPGEDSRTRSKSEDSLPRWYLGCTLYNLDNAPTAACRTGSDPFAKRAPTAAMASE